MSDKNNSGLEVARPDTLPSALPVVAHRVRDSWQDEWQFIEVQPKNWNCAEPLVRLSDAEAALAAKQEPLTDVHLAEFVRAVEVEQGIPSDAEIEGCPVCVTCGLAPDAEALNAELVEALREIESTYFKTVAGDIARAVLAKVVKP